MRPVKRKPKKVRHHREIYRSPNCIFVHGLATDEIHRITWGQIWYNEPTREQVRGFSALSKVKWLRYPHLKKKRPIKGPSKHV